MKKSCQALKFSWGCRDIFNYLRSLWSESKHRDKIKTGRLIARIYYAINQTVKVRESTKSAKRLT